MCVDIKTILDKQYMNTEGQSQQNRGMEKL